MTVPWTRALGHVDSSRAGALFLDLSDLSWTEANFKYNPLWSTNFCCLLIDAQMTRSEPDPWGAACSFAALSFS